MKKFSLVALCFLGLSFSAKAQTITLTINAGLLENALGTAVEPNGGLLQLLASPSGTFSAPTSSSYVTGDNVLVQSFAMNSNSGTAGLTVNTLASIPLTTANYTLTAGETLLLRFYPSLTYVGMPSSPTLATSYGQVRSSTVEFGGTKDPSETPWVVPAGGSAKDFDYVTVSGGGTYANTSAYATGIVIAGLVPEPSTYAMLIGGVTGLVGLRVWNRRRTQLASAA